MCAGNFDRNRVRQENHDGTTTSAGKETSSEGIARSRSAAKATGRMRRGATRGCFKSGAADAHAVCVCTRKRRGRKCIVVGEAIPFALGTKALRMEGAAYDAPAKGS